MMMKFNFGCDPLTLKAETENGFIHISINLDNGYEDEEIPVKEIQKLAEKLYNDFEVSSVQLYRDDMFICEIEKEEEDQWLL